MPTEASAMAIALRARRDRARGDPRRAAHRRAVRPLGGLCSASIRGGARRPRRRPPRAVASAPDLEAAGRPQRSASARELAYERDAAARRRRRDRWPGSRRARRASRRAMSSRTRDAVAAARDARGDCATRLEGVLPVVPSGLGVVVHPTRRALALAQPAVPALRRLTAPAARRYVAGWFTRARSTCWRRGCWRSARRTCAARARC